MSGYSTATELKCVWKCDWCDAKCDPDDDGWVNYPDMPEGWTNFRRGWYRALRCPECSDHGTLGAAILAHEKRRGAFRVNVINCARCQKDHGDVLFERLSNHETYTHWGWCITKGEPIMMTVEEVKSWAARHR